MSLSNVYHADFAAAYVRGEAIRARAHSGLIVSADGEINGRPLTLPPELSIPPLEALSPEEIEAILSLGRVAGLKLYHFKKSHGELPRVKYVLGFLRSLYFDSLLDVGSGRGAFLWPFMSAFPHVKVESVDLLPRRVEFLETVRLGGARNLRAAQADLCKLSGADASCDVVTLLEVLEHIPDVDSAIWNAVRLAKKYVVVSVPSKPDDNPEHIHLLTKDTLARSFSGAGASRLRFDGVSGHLLLIAAKEA